MWNKLLAIVVVAGFYAIVGTLFVWRARFFAELRSNDYRQRVRSGQSPPLMFGPLPLATASGKPSRAFLIFMVLVSPVLFLATSLGVGLAVMTRDARNPSAAEGPVHFWLYIAGWSLFALMFFYAFLWAARHLFGSQEPVLGGAPEPGTGEKLLAASDRLVERPGIRALLWLILLTAGAGIVWRDLTHGYTHNGTLYSATVRPVQYWAQMALWILGLVGLAGAALREVAKQFGRRKQESGDPQNR